jgi:hypothetical protein
VGAWSGIAKDRRSSRQFSLRIESYYEVVYIPFGLFGIPLETRNNRADVSLDGVTYVFRPVDIDADKHLKITFGGSSGTKGRIRGKVTRDGKAIRGYLRVRKDGKLYRARIHLSGYGSSPREHVVREAEPPAPAASEPAPLLLPAPCLLEEFDPGAEARWAAWTGAPGDPAGITPPELGSVGGTTTALLVPAGVPVEARQTLPAGATLDVEVRAAPPDFGSIRVRLDPADSPAAEPAAVVRLTGGASPRAETWSGGEWVDLRDAVLAEPGGWVRVRFTAPAPVPLRLSIESDGVSFVDSIRATPLRSVEEGRTP